MTEPNTLSDKFGALQAQLAAQHAAILARLDTLEGGGATEATVAAIRDAIGTLSSYPSYWTVKELLAQINGHIANLPSGAPPTSPDPTDVVNDDPGTCGDVAEAEGRASWINTGETLTIGADECEIWQMVPVSVGGILAITTTTGVMQVSPAFDIEHPSGWVEFCTSWDFTGNNAPLMWQPKLGTEGQAGEAYVGIVPTVVGALAVEMRYNLEPVATRYISVYFAMPVGLLMPNNVFWHVRRQWVS